MDPANAPTLDTADWPDERVQKTRRHYAMQYYRETANTLGTTRESSTGPGDTAPDFGAFMVALGQASGDEIESTQENGTTIIRQTTWRLMRDVDPISPPSSRPGIAFPSRDARLRGHDMKLRMRRAAISR